MNSSRLGLSSGVDDEQQSNEEFSTSTRQNASGREKKIFPSRLQTKGCPFFVQDELGSIPLTKRRPGFPIQMDSAASFNNCRGQTLPRFNPTPELGGVIQRSIGNILWKAIPRNIFL